MASDTQHHQVGGVDQNWPVGVVWALRVFVGGLIAGGLYLMAVRGDVLLQDLSRIAALICG